MDSSSSEDVKKLLLDERELCWAALAAGGILAAFFTRGG